MIFSEKIFTLHQTQSKAISSLDFLSGELKRIFPIFGGPVMTVLGQDLQSKTLADLVGSEAMAKSGKFMMDRQMDVAMP